jgi:hypothetical protein
MATNTYVALDKVTLGTATASVTFSSIPSTYTDLIIIVQGAISSTNDNSIYWRANGDTTTIYSATRVSGDGTSASSYRQSGETAALTGFIGTANQTINIIQFMNYANSSTYKTSLARGNNSGYNVGAFVSLWRNTAAITSITLFAPSVNFNTGSTFSLYGIKAEGTGTSPKATGGVITSDATYYYHTFNYSGTFTPNQSLSCDILQIAGGGAGGQWYGGGGGAGALRYFTSQALTATGYTVTVGAGGAGVQGSINAARGNSGSATQFAALTSSPGGGGGGTTQTNASGLSGGCGGGGAYSANGGAGSVGYAGGNQATAGYSGGGGGGMGAVGQNTSNVGGIIGGNGGAGLSTYSSWGAATNTGQNVGGTYWYAGGGGGSGQLTQGTGGNGGGGSYLFSGMAFTGGGGHGWGSSGGSGLVIVRYAK